MFLSRFVSAGGIRALGKLHNLDKKVTNELFEFLRSLTEYGQPQILESVRPAAIGAFSEYASSLESKRLKRAAIETLVDLLRDPANSVKVNCRQFSLSPLPSPHALQILTNQIFFQSAAIEGLIALEAKSAIGAVRAVKNGTLLNPAKTC